MFSVADNVETRMLKEADVNLVVIGNGSYNMIKSYRRGCFNYCDRSGGSNDSPL